MAEQVAAEVILAVRVRLAGPIKDLEQAKDLARRAVENGRLEVAPEEGAKGQAEEGSGGVALVKIEGLAASFASMG